MTNFEDFSNNIIGIILLITDFLNINQLFKGILLCLDQNK